MKIYLSGPITGDPDYKTKFRVAAEQAKRYMENRTYEEIQIVNPARISIENGTHEEYMEMCFMLLEKCDVICMLPGWEKSFGAVQEYGYAKAKGIEIEEMRQSEKRRI